MMDHVIDSLYYDPLRVVGILLFRLKTSTRIMRLKKTGMSQDFGCVGKLDVTFNP